MDTREGSLPWGMFRQLCPKKLDLGDCHYVPQVYHVFERGDLKEGKQVCHHVLRMEQLHKQFSALISSYGLHHLQLGDHEHTGRVCAVIWSAAAIQKSRIFTYFYSADYEAFDFLVKLFGQLGLWVDQWRARTDVQQIDSSVLAIHSRSTRSTRMPMLAVGEKSRRHIQPRDCDQRSDPPVLPVFRLVQAGTTRMSGTVRVLQSVCLKRCRTAGCVWCLSLANLIHSW